MKNYYTLILVLTGTPDGTKVKAKVLPQDRKAYIFKGFSDKAYFIGEVQNHDNAGTYRVIEGNRNAFRGTAEAIANPTTIKVELI